MLFFKGTINVVDDLNLAINFGSQGCKVIHIGELNPNLPPTFVACPILLPPYDVLCAEMDGDMQTYSMLYSQYLNSTKECYDTIMTILVSCYVGQNIIFYIEEGNELHHKQFLMEFFWNRFGIQIGYVDREFYILPNAELILYALLYEFMGDRILLGMPRFDPVYILSVIDNATLLSIPVSYPYAGYLLDKIMSDIGCENLEELRIYQEKLAKFKYSPTCIEWVIPAPEEDDKS